MLRCYRLIADVECTGVLKLVFHYSLFTIHCSLRSRCRFYCRFARPHRLCQTIREDNRSTAETLRNPHYVRVRGDDLKARKMLDLSEVRVRPHKRSAANLKRLTRFLDVTREPERSEGGHSQKIVPGLEALTSGQNVKPGPERSEGPA